MSNKLSHRNSSQPGVVQQQRQQFQDVPQEVSIDLFQRFLENQSKELDPRSRELELQHKAEDHNFEYAKSALDAQVDDRKAIREHHKTLKKYTYWFITGLTFFTVGTMAYSLYLGKDVVALEIIKAVIFLLSGGASGYAIGKAKTNQKAEEDKK